MMNPTIEMMMAKAEERGIEPSFPAGIPSDQFLRLTKGTKSLIVQKTKSPFLSAVSAKLITDKFLSGKMMEEAGIPVARKRLSRAFGPDDVAFLREHGELVVKPNGADRGVGVTLRVRTEEGLRAAFEEAAAARGAVLLEPYIEGREYRILVIDEKIAGVLEWRPLTAPGENSRPGGEVPLDRTDEIHPDFQALALRAARLFAVDVAGIDLIAPAIDQPVDRERPIAVLEVNPGPDFLWHVNPAAGVSRPVFEMYLDFLFP